MKRLPNADIVLAQLSTAFFTLDHEWRLTYVNPYGERLFKRMGQPPAALIGQRLCDAFPEEAGAPFARAYRRALDEHTPVTVEAFYPPLHAWLQAQVHPTPDGLSVFLNDITDRIQSDEALRDSEERYRSVVELTPDLVAIHQDGILRYVNPAGAALAGARAADALLGRSIFEVVHPDSLPLLKERVRRLMGTSQRVGFMEWKMLRLDGDVRDVESTATPISFHGEPAVLVVARDITERKQAEEMRRRGVVLEAENRQVAATTRLKTEFLASMSHELRTPLNAIIGFAELLHDEKVGTVTETQQSYLADILASATHLLQLINGILDLAKVEAGKLEFHPEPVVLAELVAEVAEIVRALAARKRLRVETSVDAALRRVVVDPLRLKQVLYNYLSNAIKFTPEHGTVTVSARPESGKRFRLEVTDTGIGIRPEDLDKLFVAFEQLEQGSAEPGTGLGLALTKQIVTGQGGSVGASSVPGKGSTFWAILPCYPSRDAPEA